MVLVLLDSRTISGRREVTAMSCGKTSFLFRSTLNSQSEARCMEEDGFLPPCRSYEPCLLPSQRLWLRAAGPTCYWLWLAAVPPIWRFPWGPCRASICTALLPKHLDNQSEYGSVYRRLLHIGCMMGLPLRPRSLDRFLVLAAGQSPSAGESSTSLDRSATVPSTIAVTPMPGPITSINPGRQVRSPSLGAPPLLPHGLFAPRGLFWLWHQPCSTSSHCSVQGPGFPGIPRPRFPGASSGNMLPSRLARASTFYRI